MQALQYALRDVDAALKPFSLRWSPRFLRQVEYFVPVYVACEGKPCDALDHLLATKVLRRLRDRYGNKQSDLDRLKSEVQDAWRAFGKDAQPQRSLAVLMAARERAMNR